MTGEGAHGNPRTVAKNWTWVKGKKILNRDRGCWQISSIFHPEVSDAQAFDPDFAAKKAYDIYKGAGWHRWCAGKKVGVTLRSCTK